VFDGNKIIELLLTQRNGYYQKKNTLQKELKPMWELTPEEGGFVSGKAW
jgi:hypothetical protein